MRHLVHPAPTAFLTACGLAAACSLALAGTARAAEGAVEPVSVRATAHFDFDKTSIKPADRAALLAEVGQMKDVTWQSVTATGYTDAVGPSHYNAKLSAKRAQNVKSYLVGKGLPPTLIKTRAQAAGEPIAPNDSEDGRAQNRRTEIEFRGVRAASK